MNPVTSIVKAMSAGAAAAAEATAAPEIKNAYAELKELIMRISNEQGGIASAIQEFETGPGSGWRQGMLTEKLADVGADRDNEVIQSAQTLWALLQPSDLDSEEAAIADDRGSIDRGQETEDRAHNLAVVRELLLAALNEDELRRVLRETTNEELRPLLQEFGPRNSRAEMADRTIDFCERRALMPDLLKEVRQVNPRQYARFHPLLKPDLTNHVVRDYLSQSNKPDAAPFRDALERYLTWVRESYKSLTFRGIKQRDQQVLTLPLDEVYTSLTAEASTRQQVDTQQLLLQSERLIVTGAPGSGKSTILQFISWTLAHAMLEGDPQVAVARLGLTMPKDTAGHPQPSEMRLPLPILIPLHAYAEYLQRHRGCDDPRKETLMAFIWDYLIRRQAFGLPDDFFEQLLVRGHSCVLLLDGLDEVPDEPTRIRVSRMVEDLAHAASDSKFIVTSRPAAYTGQAVFEAQFRHLHIRPMTAEQVERLVTRLYGVAFSNEKECKQETTSLLKAIGNLERLRLRHGADERLITTPLLVRMIVIVHFSRRKLPEQRAELYQEVIETLLTASHHLDINVAQALSQVGGLTVSQRRDLLGKLAFHMHQQGEGTRSIQELELKTTLVNYLEPQEGPQRTVQLVEAFITAARQRADFLDERLNHYQFVHLSFQEFLAAHHMAETIRDVDQMAEFLEAGRLVDSWWREPTLLLLGYLSNSSPPSAVKLARRLAQLPTPGAPDPGWSPLEGQARLAGAALAAAGILEQPDSPPPLRKELADLLTELLTSGAGPKEWAATGDTLARLGDPRPGVGVRQDGIPDIRWCEVPVGVFQMGSDETVYGDEKCHEQGIALSYSISTYPITNAQYSAFVEDGGYSRRDYWTKPGWDWREEEAVTGVQMFGPIFELANHPVVGVSWYEAVAFCRWLSRLTDQMIRLPTEAEWEKAARGTDKRTYSWGSKFAKDKCNTQETGIGTTSTVGLFAKGVSPCGAQDMIGNIWEWCQSVYISYPYHAGEDCEDLEAYGSRVMRGGSFEDSSQDARCAYRDYAHPAHRNRNVGFRVVLLTGCTL